MQKKRKPQVLYISDQLGSKIRGGSSLAGARFYELLKARYPNATLVTDALTASKPVKHNNVIYLKNTIYQFSLRPRQFIAFIISKFINIFRKKGLSHSVKKSAKLIVVNSFTHLFNQIDILEESKVHRVCIVHGDTDSFDFQPFGRPNQETGIKPAVKFLNQFHSLIFVSRSIEKKWLPFLRNDIISEVVYNSLDEDSLDRIYSLSENEARSRLSIPADEFAIVVVGSIQTRKGQDLFGKIIRRLAEEIPKFKIHFIGNISDSYGGKDIYRSFEHINGQSVEFHGHRDDALLWVRAANIAINVSRSEAFALNVLEYMALEKPVISTNVSGPNEMIEDSISGILIDIDDSNALFDAIKRIESDPEFSKQIARNARAVWMRRFTKRVQEERFNEAFHTIEAKFAMRHNNDGFGKLS